MNFICPICKNNEYKNVITCKDYTVSKENFNIVECKKCGLWQTFPYPEKDRISGYYESKEYISHSDTKQTFFEKIYHLVRKYTVLQKVNLINQNVPCGTILDFGCGTGYFLKSAEKQGFEAYGVEPSPIARGVALSKKLNVFPSLSDIFALNKKFDVITLWHVLEHLYNPDEFINQSEKLLKDKSFLILALPNRNSYDARYYKEYWAGYDAPRHLFHFTKKDIIRLIKNKFNLLTIQPMYFDSFYVSILSEKYKDNSYPFLRGMYRGFISNISAIKTNEYSSLIYVLQKI